MDILSVFLSKGVEAFIDYLDSASWRARLAILVGLVLVAGISVILWLFVSSTAGIIVGGGSPAVALIFFGVRRKESENKNRHERIKEAEQRYAQDPQPQYAWDYGRLRLEAYLERNISQVRSVFTLVVFVMLVGFGLVFLGVLKAFSQPEALTASAIAAGSGVLINFIGATFLVIYRSTMAQARAYVDVLERINAVGMAYQVLESIESTNESIKPKALADLAGNLLAMYCDVGNDSDR